MLGKSNVLLKGADSIMGKIPRGPSVPAVVFKDYGLIPRKVLHFKAVQ